MKRCDFKYCPDCGTQLDRLYPSDATACSPSSLTPETDATLEADWYLLEEHSSPLSAYKRMTELSRERDEWKSALLRIHATGRGTPDEMATDIIEGIEAAKNALRFHSENA